MGGFVIDNSLEFELSPIEERHLNKLRERRTMVGYSVLMIFRAELR